MSRKILLFDGFSVLNRAFYALPLLSTSDGEYTNAVLGFMNIFLRFLDEEKPDFITVAWDLPQPTFRHQAYGAYKGTRKGMPDELRAQVPTLKNLLEKMEINMAECPGFEADDVIGTLATKAVDAGLVPVIISGDRDLLQLATDTIKIRLPKTKAGKTEVEDYFATDVMAKYGVTPKAYIDVKALMGDTSDNVPGVPGIGEVTATKIISTYGSLDAALENATDIKPKKAAENLVEFKEQALLSKMLVTITTDAPVELCLQPPHQMWNANAHAEIKRLELKSLSKRFGSNEMPQTVRELTYKTINKPGEAQVFFSNLVNSEENTGVYLLWGETQLVGMAVATQGGGITYIATDCGELSLFSEPGIASNELLEMAKPWLEQAGQKGQKGQKCIFDSKSEARRLHAHGICLQRNVSDAMLAAYVLNSLNPCKTPTDIAFIYLQETLQNLDDILDNKGKRSNVRRTTKDLPIEVAAKYAAGVADALLRAQPIIDKALEESGQTNLCYGIEHPVAAVLLDMELMGIKADRTVLTGYGDTLNQQLLQLTAAIYELAGEEFNINSPSQVGTILFEKLGLKGGKKTTQGYSTAAEILEKLADKHFIVPLILEYRAHAKLKSTYVDGLLPLINPTTLRIHSTFNQALTATGRLSSAEPNLQNIPVRVPLGRELRKAFVPREGHVFVDADYSQIELRLLAHMSGDQTLINAFREGQDIHRLTASQVLNIAPQDVTDEQRNNAKAVNFGIIYGMGAFGLSEDLKIPVKMAEEYIAGYFEKYPGVKKYMHTTIENAKNSGYVATMYNRRRAMPELHSANFNTRNFGERVAMNMPIQGSAADIIKIAMINVAARLKREGLETKLILQVHDELLLEAPLAEVEQIKHILKDEMENVAKLEVPLIADVNVGDSWYDTK